jgi:hypothetical protein
MTRPELQDRLASAIAAVRLLDPADTSRLVAQHLQALLAEVQEGPITERPRPIREILTAAFSAER